MTATTLDGLTQFLDALPVGALLQSVHSEIVVYANHIALVHLGLSAQELVGHRLHRIWQQDGPHAPRAQAEGLHQHDASAARPRVKATRSGKFLQLSRSVLNDEILQPLYYLYVLQELAPGLSDEKSAQPMEQAELQQQWSTERIQAAQYLDAAQRRLAEISGRQRVALIEILAQLEALQARRDSVYVRTDLTALAERTKTMLSIVDDALISTFGEHAVSSVNTTSSVLEVAKACINSMEIVAKSAGTRLTIDESSLKDLMTPVNTQVLKLLLIQLLSALLMGRNQLSHIHLSANNQVMDKVELCLTVRASVSAVPTIKRQIGGYDDDRRHNNIRFAAAACHLVRGELEIQSITTETLQITLRLPSPSDLAP